MEIDNERAPMLSLFEIEFSRLQKSFAIELNDKSEILPALSIFGTLDKPVVLDTHGTADSSVDLIEFEWFAEKLKAAGEEYKFIPVPNGSHSYPLFSEHADLRAEVLEFYKNYLK